MEQQRSMNYKMESLDNKREINKAEDRIVPGKHLPDELPVKQPHMQTESRLKHAKMLPVLQVCFFPLKHASDCNLIYRDISHLGHHSNTLTELQSTVFTSWSIFLLHS